MPQLFHAPPNSLDRAHRKLTKMMQAQYAGELPVGESGSAAQNVADIIEFLDDSIETSRALLIDIEATIARQRGKYIDPLPSRNLEAMYRLIRRAQPLVAAFDAKVTSAVSISAIETRMSDWKVLIDQIVASPDQITMPAANAAPGPATQLGDVRKAISEVSSAIVGMYTALNSKLLATSKFVGSGWAASNAF
jgi:hypothetical protein